LLLQTITAFEARLDKLAGAIEGATAQSRAIRALLSTLR
jgi:hypothetical protein